MVTEAQKGMVSFRIWIRVEGHGILLNFYYVFALIVNKYEGAGKYSVES